MSDDAGRSRNSAFRIALAALAAAGLTGCGWSGLSARETPGASYSAYVNALYEDADVSSAGRGGPVEGRGPVAVRTPARIGVAQAGEVAPAQAVLERLRAEPGLIASAAPVAAYFPESAGYGAPPFGTTHGGLFGGRSYDASAADRPDAALARARLRAMRQQAADLGMDYLFLYGGTMDFGTEGTGWRVFDLTVVGAFVVPSQAVRAVGRGSGSLIDVRTGRLVLAVSSEAEASRLASTVGQYDAQVEVLKGLRERVVAGLGEQLVVRLRETGGRAAEAAPAREAAVERVGGKARW